MGRPTDYSPELAAKLCKQLALGNSLRAVCRADDMPDISTIYDWFIKYPDFTKQYEKACQDRVEAQHEDLNEISDEALQYAKTNEINVQAVMTAYKLKADNMKWSMARMKPKKYGDKLDLDHTTNGKDLPTPLLHVLHNPSNTENIEINEEN